jgi:hypothetical protein
MTIQNPLGKNVRTLPSNVDIGTITIIVQRHMVWLDAQQRLGEAEMENYHRTASGVNLAEHIYKWVKHTYPNARLVVSAEPGIDEEGNVSPLPCYVGLSPDFPDEAKVIKRIMRAIEDMVNNPQVWLVPLNSPTHVAISKRHGVKDKEASK